MGVPENVTAVVFKVHDVPVTPEQSKIPPTLNVPAPEIVPEL